MAERAFEQVLARLEAEIAAGRLTAGARLPAERDLAAQLGVARSSVREALRVLEALGLIETRRGPEHGARLREHPGDGFGELVRMHLQLRHATVADLVAFRVLVESWAVIQAVDRGGPEVAHIVDLADVTADDALAPDRFVAADADLHIAIVRAAANPILSLVAEGLRSAMERSLLERALADEDWRVTRGRLAAEHVEIASLMAAERGPDAAAALERHIRGFLRPG